jgi:hypothetical protein
MDSIFAQLHQGLHASEEGHPSSHRGRWNSQTSAADCVASRPLS